MKLIEIPVYAITESTLNKRVAKAYDKFKQEYLSHEWTDANKVRHYFDITNYPARLWPYNHMVGVIVVLKEGQDIKLKWYTSRISLERYRWTSKVKRHLREIYINGYHFNIDAYGSGAQIQKKLRSMLESFAGYLKKDKGYFVDFEAYNSLDKIIDYTRVHEL